MTTTPAETPSTVETVRALFAAYWTQDRAAYAALLAPEFTFTSPQDDHIDRDACLERCFPTASRLVRQELDHVVAADAEDVLVVYTYELATGEVHRNTELLTVSDGRVVATQVFFGGAVRET